MQKSLILRFFLLGAIFTSCNKTDANMQGEFEFISQYSATVTVGGVVGITERTFNEGEIYPGITNENGTVTIRIAEHTELNEDCPNSWCYQEFLDVPQEYMKRKE